MTPNEHRAQFGARLRAHREARALSVLDLVKLTKIPAKSVDLLEGGALDDLPAAVFVRGFLKSYCRAVGIDARETLLDYEGVAGRQAPPASLVKVGSRTRAVEGPPPEEREDSFVVAAGKGTGRMGLTLAVIILVIVATLTLSMLLRRPSHLGDGVSALPPPPAAIG